MPAERAAERAELLSTAAFPASPSPPPEFQQVLLGKEEAGEDGGREGRKKIRKDRRKGRFLCFWEWERKGDTV